MITCPFFLQEINDWGKSFLILVIFGYFRVKFEGKFANFLENLEELL